MKFISIFLNMKSFRDGLAVTGFTGFTFFNLSFTGSWVAWIAFGSSCCDAWIHWNFNWVFICCGFE